MLHFFIFALSVGASQGYTTKVIGGTDAAVGEFPSAVSIQSSGRLFCGGTILDEYHILTAAHCKSSRMPEDMEIQHGVVDIRENVNKIKVVEFIAHPLFTRKTGFYDVGVVKLAEAIPFDKNTQPAKLPEQDSPTPEEATATLVGWGRFYNNGPGSPVLQKVDITIANDVDCEDMYKDYHLKTNSSLHICGLVPGAGKGQCSGDSGGPLYVNGTQVGTVSWSEKPCGRYTFSGVYTKVSAVIDWINEQMEV